MLEEKRRVIKTRALLVNIIFSKIYDNTANELEFQELAKSGKIIVVDIINCRVNKRFINPKYLIGQGQLKNIHLSVVSQEVDLVIFNYDISASQQKHLEEFLVCKILDRTELILHIFAQRARTFEGKLQVELARLKHLSTRLVRVWTHLERQRGGVGLRGGPGEKQLEIDRRIIKVRISNITKKLEQIKRQRGLHRNARKKSRLFTVSLVGYTNSGKSTLFNLLTNSKVETLNMPFVTLDPTIRPIFIPKVGKVILADTVGFIKDLPHDLIAAFKATLEEINEADLLLHVIDVSDNDSIERKQQVLKVLEQIGASQVPILEVYNKIDQIITTNILTPPEHVADQDSLNVNNISLPLNLVSKYGVNISALYNIGIKELRSEIGKALCVELVHYKLNLFPSNAAIRVELLELGAIDKEVIDPITGEIKLEISVNKQSWDSLCNKFIDLPKMVMT